MAFPVYFDYAFLHSVVVGELEWLAVDMRKLLYVFSIPFNIFTLSFFVMGGGEERLSEWNIIYNQMLKTPKGSLSGIASGCRQ